GANYHLILLEERIPPKAVKFEDVKDSVRADLEDRLTQVTIQKLRQQLSAQVLQLIQIENPVLKKQFADRLTQQQTQIKDPEAMKKEMERERNRNAPATAPAVVPAPIVPPAATAPAAAPAAPTTTPSK
ncbi:MAG TPA: hypothetical protein VL282_10780, partial [Tepidisphaeraceae bacterium]|nr:hypothetical protein [Tepidisphaeraceae bacterium]